MDVKMRLVLNYLESLQYDICESMIGPQNYNRINGVSPKEFVQNLLFLKEDGYIGINFLGNPSENTHCIITMTKKMADDKYCRERNILYLLNKWFKKAK